MTVSLLAGTGRERSATNIPTVALVATMALVSVLLATGTELDRTLRTVIAIVLGVVAAAATTAVPSTRS